MEILFSFIDGADQEVGPPSRQTPSSAGFDIRANLRPADRDLGLNIAAGEIVTVPTGIMLAMPDDVVCDLRSRSGLARNFGIVVLNSPGTIDPDFRGEILVLLINHGRVDRMIKHGERIAQLVFMKFLAPEIEHLSELNQTLRGAAGFGSTGDD